MINKSGIGGNGIKRSLDELVAACLSYDFSEPPRLISRKSCFQFIISSFMISIIFVKTSKICNGSNSKNLSNSLTSSLVACLTEMVLNKPLFTVHNSSNRVHGTTAAFGDHKYGWQPHRNWTPLYWSNIESHSNMELPREKTSLLISTWIVEVSQEKAPRLHLHHKQMICLMCIWLCKK
ncbi:unnamed protein product [Malus baccata var. baccata]